MKNIVFTMDIDLAGEGRYAAQEDYLINIQ